MKIVCNKCEKVEDINRLRNEGWLNVSTEHNAYWFCKRCADGFWMAVDNQVPPVVRQPAETEGTE